MTTVEITERWIEVEHSRFDVGDWIIEDYRQRAADAAAAFRLDNQAFASLAPGNGTAYDIVLTNLDDAAAQRLGGSMLVSLPHFGVCHTMSPTALHVPEYVREKFPRLSISDAAVVAAFLSLVSAYLAGEL